MTVFTVMLFPQPDSPTRPTMLPSGTARSTPSTARPTPFSVWKNVCRSFISNRFSVLMLIFLIVCANLLCILQIGIQYVPQAVTEEIEGEHDEHDGQAGSQGKPRARKQKLL